jgi:hypothetical protein
MVWRGLSSVEEVGIVTIFWILVVTGELDALHLTPTIYFIYMLCIDQITIALSLID